MNECPGQTAVEVRKVRSPTAHWIFVTLAIGVVACTAVFAFDSAVFRLTTFIAGACLVLWLSEIVPPFVPSLILWALIPLMLAPHDRSYNLSAVLSWAADPILALFFGGFVLGVAAQQHGLDVRLARATLGLAKGSFTAFLLLVILLTAFLSMWMSNIAAAALMLACLRPILRDLDTDSLLRRGLLVGIALGANLGGISTPVGTGPNAIAIAAVSGTIPVSFISWMSFALPLALGMLLLGFLLIWIRTRRAPEDWTGYAEIQASSDIQVGRAGYAGFVLISLLTITMWLTEPWHGISAGVVSLGSAALFFVTGLLKKTDLRQIDWSTLLLIAGGITLGRLLEHSGLVKALVANINWAHLHPTVVLLSICLASAVLASLMSNTATAVMLIPLAAAIVPGPSTAILVAIAASFGMPFVISTPPNAMVYGKGGVRFHDLFLPGMVIMVVGCIIVTFTGPDVLALAGIK